MITIQRTDTEISVVGHANDEIHPKSDETTQACAAITALTQSLLYGVWELGQDCPEYVIEKGNFKLDTEHLSDKSKLLIDAFFVGVNAVAEAYGEYIEIK